MNDHIICPHCKKQIPLSDAFTHEVREDARREFRAKAEEYIKNKETEYRKRLEEEKIRIEKEQLLKQKSLEEKTKAKIEEEMKLMLQDTKNESLELKKQKDEMQNQLLELTKTIRQLKSENEGKQLELEKKLAQEQEKIREEERKRMDEEFRLKLLEKEKQLEDARRSNDDLRRKLDQGSQQTQGEVLELELENVLRAEFPYDEITPVAKGVRGGDLIQTVRSAQGKSCGMIIWEFKRTKAWSNEWLNKLKDDQRAQKAEYAVIITEALPQDMKNFGWIEKICIGNFSCVKAIGHTLRNNLLEIALLRASQVGKSGKMEILYNYIYGTEFRQRMSAIMDAITALQSNTEKEKRWFSKKWAEDEKNLRKFLDNTMGMSGDIQGITGKELEGADDIPLLDDGDIPPNEPIQEDLLEN